MKKVAIIYKTIPQYRRDFYNGLRSALAERDIELILLYGQPSRRDALKNDTIDLDWAIKVPSKIFEIGHLELYWQPVLPCLKDVDLVIVEQASKLLVNYVLLFQNWFGIRKLAFWGHGKNFQATSRNQFAEWIKRIVSTRVHWWFAYNDMSARIVRELGFPEERITSVQNAIDTDFLSKTLRDLKRTDIEKVRSDLNIISQNVGIYVGGLYPEKRLSFLLESLQHVRQQVPDFEMIFIGGGEDARLVEQAASDFPWIHYVGPKFDHEKVKYYAISKLFLMPGLIGLAILDTFAMGTPLVTINIPGHSPEISYLENGVNGIMLADPINPQGYAEKIAYLFHNPEEYKFLQENCKNSSEKYSLDNMVKNFAIGIEKALGI